MSAATMRSTRRLAQRSLQEAAEATRRLAAYEPSDDLEKIADAVSAAARLADETAPESCSAAPAPQQSTATQVDMLFEGPAFEWPPPPRSSPDDIWEAPAPAPPSRSTTEKTKGSIRRRAATEIQRACRGFSLRRRLALLRDRLGLGGDPTTSESGDGASTATFSRSDDRAETKDDERAVIHAFALAALLGDGSPRRVARARALVETLKDLPEIAREPSIASAKGSSAGPTLDQLEASLRDALARVALEEKWNIGDSDAKETAARLSAAVEAHPGFAARRAAEDARWELRQKPANDAALDALRELVPRDVASSDKPTIARALAAAVGVEVDNPLLAPLVERVWNEKVLWLVHVPKDKIAKTHIADLRSRYDFANLDPVELRAVYAALPDAFDNDDDGSKFAWRAGLRHKLVEISSDEPSLPPKKTPDWPAGAYDVLDATKAAKAAEARAKRSNSEEEASSIASSVFRRRFGILPWRECWDDNHNRHYFFNDRTGESKWDEPDEDYVPLPEDSVSEANSLPPSDASVPPADPPADLAGPRRGLDPVTEEDASYTSSPRPPPARKHLA